ncbi:hypothetical protein I3843_13G134700 [Carya illinoinensis]|nr:hypothetical protein I3843_13G134700 [Carya illinoinensis]
MEWYFMCKKAVESVDHLLLHCDVTKVLWDCVFRRSGLTWVMPKLVVGLLACWTRLHTCSQVAAVWKMIPLCIWLERNERCFNNRECGVEELGEFFMCSLFSWFSAIVLNGGACVFVLIFPVFECIFCFFCMHPMYMGFGYCI